MEIWISAHRFATFAKLFSVFRVKAELATQPRFIEKSGFPVKSKLVFFSNGKDVCVATAALLCF